MNNLFPADVYVKRRKSLVSKISNGVGLFIGNTYSPANYPANSYRFRQDSTFLYFFGLNLSNLAAIIDFEENSVCLYGNDFDVDDIIWMGPQPTINELASLVGIGQTKPLSKLEEDIKEILAKNRKIHFTPPYRHQTMILLSKLLNIPIDELKNNASTDLIKAIVSLREVKDEYEIEEMQKAAKIGYEMHQTAIKMCYNGVSEQKIAGTVEGIALAKGSGVSFQPICSICGEILHNHNYSNTLSKGDMLLLDCGAETLMHYCSDFTRVYPVNGKFLSKQKDIYNIVLEANNKAFKMIKPGVFFRDVHIEACRTIAEGLKELKLLKGKVDDIVSEGAHALFFPHGLGHPIGLDVHDMEDYGEQHVGYDDEVERSTQFGLAYLRFAKRLKTGFTLTIEPGIYFIPALIEKWKAEHKFTDMINYDKVLKYINFGGIRLEDDIIVTDKGAKYIGKRLPITIKEIEKEMA